MAYVITLMAPSQAGKGVVMDMIFSMKNKYFNPKIFPKYTTRPIRATDGDDIININNTIPEFCDLVYEGGGQRYGIRMDSLYDELAKGNSPVLVVNDVRAIQDIRNALSPQVITLFIYRSKPDLNKYIAIEKERYNGTEIDLEKLNRNANLRYQKASDIYRIFIENIDLFDHVIINSGTLEQTRVQVESIINKIINSEINLLEGGI